MMQDVTTTEQVAELLRSCALVRVAGGGTKPATSGAANVSLSKLSGVLHYDPGEFTFTARAGTRIDEVQQLLASKNQYLPFDPPLVEAGATLGGTVAAGLSGSGRFRYGGVRDFLLGVQLVTGLGEIVATGSKVVKNAAGFDFPKLMVGSLGKLGVMTELTFKVFPAPQCFSTVVLETDHLPHAVELMQSLAISPLDLACLDIDASHSIWARIAGMQGAVERRAQRLLQFAGGRGSVLTDQQDVESWRGCREFHWVPDGYSLVKAAITPAHIATLAASLDSAPYRICAGGHLAWIAWPRSHSSPARSGQALNDRLRELGVPAVALTGDWPSPSLGEHHGHEFDQRLTTALDPNHKLSQPEPMPA